MKGQKFAPQIDALKAAGVANRSLGKLYLALGKSRWRSEGARHRDISVAEMCKILRFRRKVTIDFFKLADK